MLPVPENPATYRGWWYVIKADQGVGFTIWGVRSCRTRSPGSPRNPLRTSSSFLNSEISRSEKLTGIAINFGTSRILANYCTQAGSIGGTISLPLGYLDEG